MRELQLKKPGKKSRFHGVLRILGVGATLSVSLACNEEPEKELPTEPWKKTDTADASQEKNTSATYVVAPDAQLKLEVPGKSGRPAGFLRGVTGQLELDLDELAHVNGELKFDLGQLVMLDVPPGKKKRKKSAPLPPVSAQWTSEALRWLGKSSDERGATFRIDSARALSHPRAAMGPLRKSEALGRVRQVYATADGRLTIRGLSVARQIPLLVRFEFPEGEASPIPKRVEVLIRNSARIPLAEHEIEPRDESGHAISEQKKLLGREVGNTARVSGSLIFELKK